MWFPRYIAACKIYGSGSVIELFIHLTKFGTATVFLCRLSLDQNLLYHRSKAPPGEEKQSCRIWLYTFFFFLRQTALQRCLQLQSLRVHGNKTVIPNSRVSFCSPLHLSLSLHIAPSDIAERRRCLSLFLSLFLPSLSFSPSLPLCLRELLYLSGGKGVMLLQSCISILLLLRLNI